LANDCPQVFRVHFTSGLCVQWRREWALRSPDFFRMEEPVRPWIFREHLKNILKPQLFTLGDNKFILKSSPGMIQSQFVVAKLASCQTSSVIFCPLLELRNGQDSHDSKGLGLICVEHGGIYTTSMCRT
jgi:hypothetical protein